MSTFKFMSTYYLKKNYIIEVFKNKCKIWVHYEYR